MPPLIEIVLDNYQVKFSSTGILSIENERITLKEFPNWFLAFCKDHKEFSPLLLDTPSPSFLLELLKTHLKIGQTKTRNSVFSGLDDKVIPYSYDDLIPFRSNTNNNIVVFYSKTKKCLVDDLSYDSYVSSIDKEYRISPVPAVVSFNPYLPEQLYVDVTPDGKKCSHLNTYKKPDWQLNRTLTKDEAKSFSKLPKIIEDFFIHLFPSEECREFAYDWLHFAIVGRCHTYLVLNGAKGVGKGLFSAELCKSLMGTNNFKPAQPSALTSNFNSLLLNCRMIVFDEFKMVEDVVISALKRNINTELMIEPKGQDVGRPQVTYNSFIIQNNALSDIKIEWDDRRFSVMDINKTKIDAVWAKDKIALLFEIISNPEAVEIRNFGYWLMYRQPVVMKDAFSYYQGEHFHKLCYTSYPEWAKMIIDEIVERPRAYFEESDLRMLISEKTNKQHRLPSKSKIEDFLKNYRHQGEFSLGHIESDERTYYLQVNEHFSKAANDNTGLNFESVDLL